MMELVYLYIMFYLCSFCNGKMGLHKNLRSLQFCYLAIKLELFCPCFCDVYTMTHFFSLHGGVRHAAIEIYSIELTILLFGYLAGTILCMLL